jgi:hypothetical protein
VRWLRALLKECKFFECTAVWPLAHQLAQSMLKDFEQYDRVPAAPHALSAGE